MDLDTQFSYSLVHFQSIMKVALLNTAKDFKSGKDVFEFWSMAV